MEKAKGHPLPLGVSRGIDGINFSIAVPQEKDAKLLLYKKDGEEPVEIIDMENSIGDLRCVRILDEDESVPFYNYLIDGKVTIDPYVKALFGKTEWLEEKDISRHEICGKIYEEEFDWEDDEFPGIPYHKVIAYTLHVRGFTKDSYSDVKNKGTFEGVIEKIPYLKELGINQIQCMPVYEFDENTQPVNYWGYGLAYYFAPKNAYSASGDGVKSLKKMVKALHKEGIEVVLEMPFDANVSKQLMIDCLRYYVTEFHVDGFVCNHQIAPLEVLDSDPYLKQTKIMKHQTEFKDVMRRFLKGDQGQMMAAAYWLKHLSASESIFNYMTSHSGFTMQDLVSYNEKHNEVNGEHNRDGSECNNSWNCGTEGPTQYNEIVALRKSQIRNAFFLMMLSQGTPCILAGDEWGNTQFGNNNVYCQDNEVGWLSWERFPYNHDLFEFVKALIAFRKKYTVFCPEKEFSGRDMTNCGIPDVSYHGKEAWRADFSDEARSIGVYYHEEIADEDVYVAYNMHWEEAVFALPGLSSKKKWYLIASTGDGVLSEGEYLVNQQRQLVDSRSVSVFVGERSYEA